MRWPAASSRARRLAPALVLAALAGAWAGHRRSEVAAIPELPPLVLWAWERPEDLRGADPAIGIAFLAQTITVDGDGFTTRPRHQPLRVRAESPLIAVTRLEMAGEGRGGKAMDLVPALAEQIATTAALPRARAVQIDFDATASQRTFYARLLGAVRDAIGPRMPLSITALASWCVGDPWLGDLPVDEVVPMLFAMGPSQAPFRAVAGSPRAAAPSCRGALGISLDEQLPTLARGRRVYVFHSRGWEGDSIAEARRLAGL